MKRKRVSGKELKKLNQEIFEKYRLENFFDKKDKIELLDQKLLMQNDRPCFLILEGKIAPTLRLNMEKDMLPKVTVDMPAVRFMVNGADVMRPGIVEMGDFNKGDFVVIVDEKHGKQLVIGKALFSSKDMRQMDKGKVIQNIHHVGDESWNI